MMNRDLKIEFRRFLSLACVILLTLSSFPMNAAAKTEYANESKIIVSLGDSYASGEGNPPFGDKTKLAEKVNDEDWLAHRSNASWSSMLTLPAVSETMADHKNENWFFVAASGATTKHIQNSFPKPYDKEDGSIKGSKDLPPQIEVFDRLGGKKADYVTLSIGGNDANFSTIITDYVMKKSSYLHPNALSNYLAQTWESFYAKNGIRDCIRQVYKDISKKAGKQATIIVTGYPTLLSEFTIFPLVSAAEADMVNNAVRNFNTEIERLVTSCRILGMDIHFVSVEDVFEGHEAFTLNPYINGIVFGQTDDLKTEWFSAYSIHPNSKGISAYASCVQAKINELEGVTEVEYAMQLKVSALEADGSLCSDYTLKITGKEDKGFWGLLSEEYSDEIAVKKQEPVRISLPKGKFLITATDGVRIYRQVVKTSKDSRNTNLVFHTEFDSDGSDAHLGQHDWRDVLSNAVTFNGHWYKVIDRDAITSWYEAQQFCQSVNGYLATITSQAENDFLYEYIKSLEYSGAYFGYSDSDTEGTWKWNNGEVSPYVNWKTGEPDGEDTKDDYARLSGGYWSDGNFDDCVFICEWGEYATQMKTDDPIRTTSDERDIVLVLDASGSMSGKPMEETKKASYNFISTILKEDASIGIVTYDNSSYMLSDFSVDEGVLTTAVSSIYTGGGTNIEGGLAEAYSMLNTSNAKKKIIVLMSDGEPNDGKTGDSLIAYSDKLKEDGIIIYTLGFFESLDSYKSSAQLLMEGIASDGCHYEVASADDLVFFFDDVADQINGQKYIYIRIACPVDVTVTYEGQTLCSADDDLSVRTDFGTLTFEDNENASSDEDNRIKVLRLKEGADYDVQITGTGQGYMDYTIGFMDENGDYSDFRKFMNVKITRRTIIDTVAAVARTSTLNIDQDGDGKYDLKLRAEPNSYGEEVNHSVLVYICAGGGVLLLSLIIVLIVRKKMKKAKETN